jgi:hypothetical protein
VKSALSYSFNVGLDIPPNSNLQRTHMTIHEYLIFNNVRLIDPDSSYGKRCIKEYTTKGYLHKDQLRDLREWSYSVDQITRLKAHPINQLSQDTVKEAPPKVTKARWTVEDVQILCDAVQENSNVFSDTVHTLESVAKKLNRSEIAVKTQLNKIGAGTTAGELRVADKVKFVDTLNQLKEA